MCVYIYVCIFIWIGDHVGGLPQLWNSSTACAILCICRIIKWGFSRIIIAVIVILKWRSVESIELMSIDAPTIVHEGRCLIPQKKKIFRWKLLGGGLLTLIYLINYDGLRRGETREGNNGLKDDGIEVNPSQEFIVRIQWTGKNRSVLRPDRQPMNC